MTPPRANSNSQISINCKNRIDFEKSLIDELKHVGAEKNTTAITVRLADGREVKTIVDIIGKNFGGMIEAKNVVDLSLSPQFRAQLQIAQETGQPLNLVVSPRNKTISQNLVAEIKKTGGEIYVYDPVAKTIKKR
jgi:filamentous hemagglutinin